LTLAKKSELAKKEKPMREKLVICGFSLFIKEGVASVSLDDILQYSGIKKGAFYYYFDSKEQFLKTCFQECYLQPVKEALNEFYEKEANSIEDILYFFTNFTVRVKAKMDAFLGSYTVKLEDVYSNISYMSRRNNFMAHHFTEFHKKQRVFVEHCLLRMQKQDLIGKDVNCEELARMMCCCREGALVIFSKDKEIDFDGEMNVFIGYFKQLLGMKPTSETNSG
jgi:AcrR family transcriptional regulator